MSERYSDPSDFEIDSAPHLQRLLDLHQPAGGR